MRKIVSIVMSLILMLTCFTGMSVFAEGQNTVVDVSGFSIDITPEAKTLAFKGDTFELDIKINSELESEKFSVSCESLKPSVATVECVEDEWIVTAIGKGNADIKVSAEIEVDGVKQILAVDVCKVTVIDAKVNKFEVIPKSFTLKRIGDGVTLRTKAEVSPTDIVPTQITYESSNSSIAKVNKDGVVTAVSAGDATITVNCNGVTQSCDIFVRPVEVNRLSGETRYETAVEISKASFNDGEANAVVLAYGKNYPDALAAAPFANSVNAPILLTDGETLSDEVKTEIKRLGARTIYLIGGESVISETLENSLELNYRVNRIYGVDRYETSLKIADKLNDNFSEIFIVSGENYPDALSVSTIAANRGCPILYTKKGEMPENVIDFIKASGCKKITIVGGNAVIPENLSVILKASCMANVTRYGGIDRYETAILIAKAYEVNNTSICIATGENYPDALTGAVYASRANIPMIIVPKNIANGSVVDSYFESKNFDSITIFGGTNAITEESIIQIIY